VNDVRIMEGGLSVDDRGSVAFVNYFGFEGVKRFYVVRNHSAGFVRAWQAHRREAKYVFLAQGSALVCTVEIDNWESPSKNLPVKRFVLSAEKPAVLRIPEGYANGFMSLTRDAVLVFFSTSTLEESRGDDIRYEARYWDPWKEEER
jgi:dTDP-4-dehydrorhamnose 3,5-epimerase